MYDQRFGQEDLGGGGGGMGGGMQGGGMMGGGMGGGMMGGGMQGGRLRPAAGVLKQAHPVFECSRGHFATYQLLMASGYVWMYKNLQKPSTWVVVRTCTRP